MGIPLCSNDAFDALTGVDSEDRKPESIVNLTGLPWHSIVGASCVPLVFGVLKFSSVLAIANSPVSSWLLAISILCGYVYQGPPFRCVARKYARIRVCTHCDASPAEQARSLRHGNCCRLSYKGLGEPLCFIAFGICAVLPAFVTMYRTMDSSMSALQLLQLHWPLLLPVTFVCGLTTTAVLFCSHFHQIEGDIAAGKRSPLVRLGSSTGCKV
jgi:2-carboxy-1,4-naphthoquinone phytyltransferase